jgi:hypothetical protein
MKINYLINQEYQHNHINNQINLKIINLIVKITQIINKTKIIHIYSQQRVKQIQNLP